MPRIRRDDTLLLLVDMQEKLQPLIHEDAAIRRNAAALAEGFRLLDVPFFVTEQYPKGLGPTVPELQEAVKAAGGVLEKTTFSCADDDGIRARIEASGRTNVVLAGVEAHICVMQTALDLLAQGHRVLLVEDAIGARDPHNKETGLARARMHGAQPANVEMLFFELMGGSRHPRFKEVQALVK